MCKWGQQVACPQRRENCDLIDIDRYYSAGMCIFIMEEYFRRNYRPLDFVRLLDMSYLYLCMGLCMTCVRVLVVHKMKDFRAHITSDIDLCTGVYDYM